MARTPAAVPRRKVLPARGVVKRVEIDLPVGDIEAIRAVAALTGESTLTAVVRDALKAYVWMITEQRRDRRIISEARTGSDRTELMPLLRIAALGQDHA